MRVYTPGELRRFLAAVDRALEHPAEVVVIGGAAAAIEYGVASGTRDIDTWTRVHEDLAVAAERARQTTGSRCPLPGAESRTDPTTSSHVSSGCCRACGA